MYEALSYRKAGGRSVVADPSKLAVWGKRRVQSRVVVDISGRLAPPPAVRPRIALDKPINSALLYVGTVLEVIPPSLFSEFLFLPLALFIYMCVCVCVCVLRAI